MSTERLVNIFKHYYREQKEELHDLITFQEELKLRREKMTKTEKEYYSRVVKKKVAALANEKLYQLARNLLERS